MRPRQVVEALLRAPIGLVIARRSAVMFANHRAVELFGEGGRDGLARALAGVDWDGPQDRTRLTVVPPSGSTGHGLGLTGVRLGRGAAAAWVLVVVDGTEHALLDPAAPALTDELTGLPTRVVLVEEVKRLRGRADAADAAPGALAFLDLDGFKGVNMQFGHQIADEVLRQVARHVREGVPADVLVTRLGGDELAVLFPRHTPAEAAAQLERLTESLAAQDVPAAGEPPRVQFSAGVTGLTAQTVDQVLAQADRALYHAKANRRGHCVLFGSDSGLVRSRRQLHEDLDQLAAERSHLQQASLTDHLTGLPNTRALDQALDDLDRRQPGDDGYAVLFIDLDRFGAYNHAHGDAAGDAVLRRVAATLREGCRPGETAFRKGGEELVVTLPGCSGDSAARVAERLRRAVEDLALPHGGHPDTPVVTITVAVASMARGYSARQLVDHASKDAFASKERRQRNRVVVTSQPGPR